MRSARWGEAGQDGVLAKRYTGLHYQTAWWSPICWTPSASTRTGWPIRDIDNAMKLGAAHPMGPRKRPYFIGMT